MHQRLRIQRAGRSLFIKERKAGDHLVQAIESRGDQVLRVVTKELKGSKHGKTSVLELLKFALLFFITKVGLSEIEVSEVSVVVNGTNEEDDLGNAESRDLGKSSNTVGDGVSVDIAWDKVVLVSTGNFRDDVSNDSKHGNTSVLELSGTVLVEGFLVNV